MDGELPIRPNGVGAAFPCTRSGHFKVTYLVKARPNADHAALFDHWLDVHVPNVTAVMQEVGGLRYVVSHSLEPQVDPYCGMAELTFAGADGWRAYRNTIQADGMEQWVDGPETLVLTSTTDMIGIP